jgi:hypothetical protein
MYDLAHYRRTHNKCVQDLPEGILDVIQVDYPNQYYLILEDQNRLTTLFSNDEWIDILTKSRNSFENHLLRLNLTRKVWAQGI